MGKHAKQPPPSRVDVGSGERSVGTKKRVSRACDECRLHKARCDGLKTCGTCFRYDRVCSYNLLPIECQGSAARIRILEHRLVKARECIEELQKQIPHTSSLAANINQTLAPQSVSKSALPTSIASTANSGKIAGTGFCFIQSLLRPLAYDTHVQTLTQADVLRSLLRIPSANKPTHHNGFCQLPPYDTMLEVVYAAFNNVFGLSNIIPMQEFRVAAQRLYDVNPISYSSDDTCFVPLFCAVTALGMVRCTRIHQEMGYEKVMKQSQLYFEAVTSTIAQDEELTSIPKLQVGLCVVQYLLNTSKVDLARPALQIVCASSIVHDLFQGLSLQASGTQGTADLRNRDLAWSISYLDTLTATLLEISPILNNPGPEMATVYTINSAAHNVAHYRRSENSFLLSVSLAMAIELMKLTQRMSPDYVVPQTHEQTSILDKKPSMDGLQIWTTLKTELDTWEYMLQSIFPANDDHPEITSVRNELQLQLYMAQIMLHHNFLSRHSEDIGMKSPSQAGEVTKGRQCVTAATNAIMYTSAQVEQSQTTTLSWLSAYILFISTVTLLVAVTSADTMGRQGIECSIEIAINILHSTKHGSSLGKAAYLEVIQSLCTTAKVVFAPITVPGSSHSSVIFSSATNSPWQDQMSDQGTTSFYGSGSSLGNAPFQSRGTSQPEQTTGERQWCSPSPQEPPSRWDFDFS